MVTQARKFCEEITYILNRKESANFTNLCEVVFYDVNLVHDQGLRGVATMSSVPVNSAWSAANAIDGDTNQNGQFLCYIRYLSPEQLGLVVGVVQRPFNVAYLGIYFGSDMCSDGTYISSGMCVRCPGRCKNDSPCNKLTGRCVQGCDKNWTGQFCEECVDGFYNRGCSGTCGSCVHGQFCEKINGHCTNGCKANYQQPLCKECEP